MINNHEFLVVGEVAVPLASQNHIPQPVSQGSTQPGRPRRTAVDTGPQPTPPDPSCQAGGVTHRQLKQQSAVPVAVALRDLDGAPQLLFGPLLLLLLLEQLRQHAGRLELDIVKRGDGLGQLPLQTQHNKPQRFQLGYIRVSRLCTLCC